ncbi:MAG: hypothetical protein Q8M92_01435, partial [Candidatus Subteraquimicrobiales bacterium]|nr:hypothetical protein [Candidatus Subteraquimicrobiales bacterium]
MVFSLDRPKKKYKTIFCCALLALISVFLLTSSLVYATPSNISKKKKEAVQIKAQIDEIDRELEEAVETYNAATIQLHEIQKQIVVKRQELEKVNAELERSIEILNARMVEIYKRGDTDFLSVLLSTCDYEDFVLRLDFLVRISEQDHNIFKKFTDTKKLAEEAKAKLEEERTRQAIVRQELNAKKKEIESRLGERKKLLASIEKEIARLIKEEEGRQARLRAEAM